MIKSLLAWWRSDQSTALGVLAFIVAIPLYFVPGLMQHVAFVLQILGALHITPGVDGAPPIPAQLTGLLGTPPSGNAPPPDAAPTAGLVVGPTPIITGGANVVASAFSSASSPVQTNTTITQAR